MFRDKVITIWMVVYDSDADKIYAFNTFKQALIAIEGSLRGYILDESEVSNSYVEDTLDKIKEYEEEPCIPIRFGNLTIVIYRWSLDNKTLIHNTLSECYDRILDADLKDKIENLFSVPI